MLAKRGLALIAVVLWPTAAAQSQTPPRSEPVWQAKERVKTSGTPLPPTPQPVSVAERITPTEVIRLEAPDLTTVRAEDAADQKSGNKRQRIGVERSLPKPVGTVAKTGGSTAWVKLQSGQQLRVFTIESVGATAIRVHFEQLSLPAGVTLLLYNADRPTEVCGPYDAAFVGRRNEFWSESIFGQRVTVECVVPPGVDVAKVRFQVREIIHNYRPVTEPTKPAAGVTPKQAGPCNNDVTCSPDWIQTSHAVARITFVDAGVSYLCSGCLIADLDTNSVANFFLTANHCIGSQTAADTLEFYWLYQTSVCDGTPPDLNAVPHTSGGADYLAGASATEGNDFSFLQLRQDPPANVTYAGWSTTALTNNQPVIVIHHPAGDFKRISFGNDVGIDPDFWEILWSSGTTEGGSSGSPLFDADHEIVGQLFGGSAACDNMSGTDVFGRFDVTFPLVRGWLLGLPPLNDNFTNAEVLTGLSGTVRDSNINATKEPGEPNHAGIPGGHSVWFRWTAPTNALVHFDTYGSGFDTTLAVYTGTSVGALTEVASNNDSTGTTSAVNFLTVGGTTYDIAVDGNNGASGSIQLSWSPWNDNFADAVVLTGSSGTVDGLNIGTSKEPGEPNHAGNIGGRSVWFRWTAPATGKYHFDTLGSDFDTLLAVYTGSSVGGLAPVASNDDAGSIASGLGFSATAGTVYSIAIDGFNDGSGAATGSLVLTWFGHWNDNFADALVVTGASGAVIGSNMGATTEPGEPNIPLDPPSLDSNPSGASVWYRWTAPASGTVTIDTEGSSLDTLMAVYTGNSIGSLSMVAHNDDLNFGANIFTSRVTFDASTGVPYQITVDGYYDSVSQVNDQGRILFTWDQPGSPGSPPANDNFAAAQALTGVSGTTSGSNRWATKEPGEPDHAGTAGGQSIWYRWTAPGGGPVTVDTLGSQFDTVLAVYTGTAVANLTAVASNDDATGITLTSQVTFTASAGTTYYIAVDGFLTLGGTIREGAVTLNWAGTTPPTPPSLSVPQVMPGGQVQFILTGTSGHSYTIEYSTDLTPTGWTAAGTLTLSGTTGIFPDTNAPGHSVRFYRTRDVTP